MPATPPPPLLHTELPRKRESHPDAHLGELTEPEPVLFLPRWPLQKDKVLQSYLCWQSQTQTSRLRSSPSPEPEKRTTRQKHDQSPETELSSINNFRCILLPADCMPSFRASHHGVTAPQAPLPTQEAQPFTGPHLWLYPTLPPSLSKSSLLTHTSRVQRASLGIEGYPLT